MTGPWPLRSPGARVVLIIFGISFLLRMGVCWWVMPRVDGAAAHVQYREYIMAGARLLEGGAFLSSLILDDDAASASTLMPPLYVGAVACVYRVCGIDTAMSNWVLGVMNAAAGAATVVGVFLIGLYLGGVRVAWIAAALACVNPMLLGYTHLVWDTCLFTLGVVGTVWWTVRLGDSDARWSWWRWGWYGLWLGVLAQLNPALTIVYPILVLWVLSRRFGWRFRPVGTGVFVVVIGWIVAIAPWTVRNYRVAGDLMYIRGGLGLEFWLGVCPQADTDGGNVYASQFPLLNDDAQKRVATLGEQDYIAEVRDQAFRAIQDDPMRYASLVGMRVVDYWLGTVYSHVSPDESGFPKSRARAVGTVFATLELALLLGLIALRRRVNVFARWLLGIVAVFSVIYVLTHVQVRFRAPVEPLFALAIALLAAGSGDGKRWSGHGR